MCWSRTLPTGSEGLPSRSVFGVFQVSHGRNELRQSENADEGYRQPAVAVGTRLDTRFRSGHLSRRLRTDLLRREAKGRQGESPVRRCLTPPGGRSTTIELADGFFARTFCRSVEGGFAEYLACRCTVCRHGGRGEPGHGRTSTAGRRHPVAGGHDAIVGPGGYSRQRLVRTVFVHGPENSGAVSGTATENPGGDDRIHRADRESGNTRGAVGRGYLE